MIKSYRRNTAFRFFEATDVAYWRLHLTLHCKDMQGKFPRCSAFWHGITLRSQPVHGFGPLRLGLDDSAQDMVIIQAGWMVCGLKNLNANGSCNAAGKEACCLAATFFKCVLWEWLNSLCLTPQSWIYLQPMWYLDICGIHIVTKGNEDLLPIWCRRCVSWKALLRVDEKVSFFRRVSRRKTIQIYKHRTGPLEIDPLIHLSSSIIINLHVRNCTDIHKHRKLWSLQ